MPDDKKTIEPIDADFDEVAKSVVAAITPKFRQNKMLVPVPGSSAITPNQPMLNLQIEKQIEVDGVGMGVLTDGTPFLTGRGLARLCGVSNARIVELSADWEEETRALTKSVKKMLEAKGIVVNAPHIEITQRSGAFYAYPDVVCIAVLEHYAFEAGAGIRDTAIQNFRLLAGKALHDFIYTQVGYDPAQLPRLLSASQVESAASKMLPRGGLARVPAMDARELYRRWQIYKISQCQD